MTSELRQKIRDNVTVDETAHITGLISQIELSYQDRLEICARAASLISTLRGQSNPGLMEVFLGEYGLSTDEGIALMCLAEALLRVPDAPTIDALIEDKIATSDWSRHLGRATSPLVNASTWALMLTGKVLSDERPGLAGALKGAVKRVGEPVIRAAVGQAMRELGRQFVLGSDIHKAMRRAKGMENQGFTYSYDMLGEAARTETDARSYHIAYSDAITELAVDCKSANIRDNPGISIKLSALHPRYERAQKETVMTELVARAKSLALLAKSARMGLNIDAEEADRLDLSLDVIEAILSDPALKGWDGFGIVVQAYSPRAPYVIDFIHKMATRLDRNIMVRLVKGAYWDSEIKRAQELGLDGIPVFTRKICTDISYLACARKLLSMTDRIYPQFATHNAHSVAAILQIADDPNSFEFQRLHGMGEALHQLVKQQENTRCRIYAPVGAHEDLLAYLVRRLLENGANSSFVNQILDTDLTPEEVAADPIKEALFLERLEHPAIKQPLDLFAPERRNSKGWDLAEPSDLEAINLAMEPFKSATWNAQPILANDVHSSSTNIARAMHSICEISEGSEETVNAALEAARIWDAPAKTRADILRKVADLYEANFGELFALATREAGKTLQDAVDELREAVDFLRYYANEAEKLTGEPHGTFACISPWNFPLAIFTGQIAAALATGNSVIAKPAETTPAIAAKAISLMHEAGVPKTALQFIPGQGRTVGDQLCRDPRLGGVCFTGSTATAKAINWAMASSGNAKAPLIAETGGLNAMIVDSTALPEQAIRDIITGAFQSAGQRCSATRVVYMQEDVAPKMLEMLFGAMDALVMGDPWELSTDVGPVIDSAAKARIDEYIGKAQAEGRVLKSLEPPEGCFVGPTVVKIETIGELTEEIFGPVLHVATFKAEELMQVVADINATGFGLTFGLHTRIDDRVQDVTQAVHAGNVYVNRNQIGAVVGVQPFGGEGLSGTGPKAGGPNYLRRFVTEPGVPGPVAAEIELPGPTGETNSLSVFPRGRVLCLGPSAEDQEKQARQVTLTGCEPLTPALPSQPVGEGFEAVIFWGDPREIRQTLAGRDGPILPLITHGGPDTGYLAERHLCVDITASGGNAALMAGAAED